MPQPTSELITATQAAKLRGVHPKTFARWRIAPAIPGRRGRGGDALYDPAIVEAYQPGESRHPTRGYVPPEPPPPKVVESPLPEGIEAQIVAGLEIGARQHHAPSWMDNLADKWLAEASKKDSASVKASAIRNPSIRERDIAETDFRVDEGGELIPRRQHVKTSTPDDWKPRKGVKMDAAERAARRDYMRDVAAEESLYARDRRRDVRRPSHDTAS